MNNNNNNDIYNTHRQTNSKLFAGSAAFFLDHWICTCSLCVVASTALIRFNPDLSKLGKSVAWSSIWGKVVSVWSHGTSAKRTSLPKWSLQCLLKISSPTQNPFENNLLCRYWEFPGTPLRWTESPLNPSKFMIYPRFLGVRELELKREVAHRWIMIQIDRSKLILGSKSFGALADHSDLDRDLFFRGGSFDGSKWQRNRGVFCEWGAHS